MKNKWVLFLKLTIGLLILGAVLLKLGLKTILRNLIEINFYYIPLFILISILILYVSCINIKILALPYNKKLGVFETFKYYTLSWALSLITPGRIGEFSLIYFLKKKDISIGQSSAIVVLDKIISLTIISTLAIIGFFKFFTTAQGIGIIIIMFILFCIFSFFIISDFGRSIIKRFILRSLSKKFEGFSKSLFEYFKNYKKELVMNLLLTLIKFFLSGLLIYSFFLAFDQFSANIIDMVLIYCILTIISLIPLSLNGLGIKEGAAIYLFGTLGFDKIIVGSIFIDLLIFNYIFAIIYWFSFFNKKTMAGLKNNAKTNL